ncbi:hypothetical protein XENORESO_004229 [Xenotaenia resolanae]|uniref:Uncharacterized protein n=1 Tax=Xenotaenia resolanae TaxID=208358 RepID=A0ABV0X2B7_9TELE
MLKNWKVKKILETMFFIHVLISPTLILTWKRLKANSIFLRQCRNHYTCENVPNITHFGTNRTVLSHKVIAKQILGIQTSTFLERRGVVLIENTTKKAKDIKKTFGMALQKSTTKPSPTASKKIGGHIYTFF